MTDQFKPSGFTLLPKIVKNLLIINGIMFLLKLVFESSYGINLDRMLGLHYPGSPDFEVYQFVSYLFMHGDFSHLFFNMFAVWMFGNAIENVWGPKRFLIFYLITGFGAALLHYAIIHFQLAGLESLLTQDEINLVMQEGADIIANHQNYVDPNLAAYNGALNVPIVGASGSLFGLLLAFGMMFPNSVLYLMFIPFPIKAKYFVIGYGAIELYSGLSNNPGDNVAHFAHLGGMLFGFIMIMYWKSKGTLY